MIDIIYCRRCHVIPVDAYFAVCWGCWVDDMQRIERMAKEGYEVNFEDKLRRAGP